MSQYINWLDARTAYYQQQRATYVTSQRVDDADLTAVRINILGVCKSIYETFSRIGKSDEAYVAKLIDLADGWTMARQAALTHDDIAQAVIESIKIETLSEACDTFHRLRRVEND